MSKIFTKPYLPIYEGGEPHDFTGDNQLGIYTNEITQRYVYGTRYLTWDGRVYKYMGVTTQGVTSYSACAGMVAAELSWTTAVAGTVGDRTYVITDTGVAEDQWAGAMVQIYHATIANSTQHFIVGNEKDNGTNVKVYLEFPLSYSPTIADSIEVFGNPYRLVQGNLSSNDFSPWVGVANVTAATGYKVWVQSWGPAILSPGNTTMDDAAGGERLGFFKADGSISEIDGAGVTASKNQMVGYILNQGTGDIAGPQMYLMCST